LDSDLAAVDAPVKKSGVDLPPKPKQRFAPEFRFFANEIASPANETTPETFWRLLP
jgi:hypothetical protein